MNVPVEEARLHRPTVAEVDVAALLHNLAAVRRLTPGTTVLAVVKANAYGHGAVPVSKELERAGVSAFGVALVEEGVELREAGLRGQILVLGGTTRDYDALMEHDLVPLVFTAEHLAALDQAAKRAGRRAKAHVKLDTGMGRIGLLPGELPQFLDAARHARHVELDGLASHFASADLADQEMTRRQIDLFRAALGDLRAAGHPLSFRHLANSAGVIDVPEVRDGVEVNLVRPGIMLYGEHPAERLRAACDLRPVLSWKTAIVHLKRVPAGTPISYGGTWVARRESLIATLPVGYADGYSRHLSSRAEVLVRGRRAPIAGRVCMDMCMADVTDVPLASPGDEVVLLGRQGDEAISADELARHCGTIHYEILCAIGARVPRVLVGASLRGDR